MRPAAPPPAPSPAAERRLFRVLHHAFLRDVLGGSQDPPPASWNAEALRIPREAGGHLAALHVAHPDPRGLVLFGHPGISAGKGYFHRNDRVPFVVGLGFAALTFDHGGFGASDAARRGFHAEWEDVLAFARRRFPGLPLHVWGVSLGGYFAHHALARDVLGVEGAIFEHVAPNLLRYRYPGRPMPAFEALAFAVAPHAARWLPAEAHAPFVRAERALYVYGTRDHGIPTSASARLVRAAGARARGFVVPGAPHLGAWRSGGEALRAAVARVLH